MVSGALIASCAQPAKSPRDALAGSLKGVDTSAFDFASSEDESREVASLTSRAVRDVIDLGTGPTERVLQYTQIKDKKSSIENTYKTELEKTNKEVRLKVTDLASNATVSSDGFRPVSDAAGGPYETLNECIADFNCKHHGELLCEANRTCRNQFAAITCQLKDGSTFSVHFVVNPSARRCLIAPTIPELEAAVKSPN